MTPIDTPNQPKIKVSQADKEKEARTVRQVFTDRAYRSQNLTEPLHVWTRISDRPSVLHGLSDRVARTVRVRCVHVRSPRLGHKETSSSLFQVWINLDGNFQETGFSKWTEWIYFVTVLNQVNMKFDSI
jgi:hypothetical protein